MSVFYRTNFTNCVFTAKLYYKLFYIVCQNSRHKHCYYVQVHEKQHFNCGVGSWTIQPSLSTLITECNWHLGVHSNSSSPPSSFLACNSRLRSAIRRHHPPQRAVLSQICCFRKAKMVMFQIMLNGAEPCDAGTTQLSSSPPVPC